jgi:hypothetical protein
MDPFRKLPNSVRYPPGLEQRIWRRLPALWFWGTLALGVVALWVHWSVPAGINPADDRLVQRWDYMLLGLGAFHWSAVLTIAFGCFIVRVMKGPAYGADVYPLPGQVPATPLPSDEEPAPPSTLA